jgi:hypothetical protein
MLDYMVWTNAAAAALPAGQVLNFGAQGANIVEATVAMVAPNRANFVTAAVNAALATEIANHSQDHWNRSSLSWKRKCPQET